MKKLFEMKVTIHRGDGGTAFITYCCRGNDGDDAKNTTIENFTKLFNELVQVEITVSHVNKIVDLT